ncbi:MAG: hypothetical protein AAFY22_14250 [Pseudomonadota bacterium]
MRSTPILFKAILFMVIVLLASASLFYWTGGDSAVAAQGQSSLVENCLLLAF